MHQWIITGQACDALLELAQEDKEKLERRKRNMDESIDNFDDNTQDISTELTK